MTESHDAYRDRLAGVDPRYWTEVRSSGVYCCVQDGDILHTMLCASQDQADTYGKGFVDALRSRTGVERA